MASGTSPPDILPFPPPPSTLSAANYLPLTAADSFVASFGQNLAATTESATALPLPTTLGGAPVHVKIFRALRGRLSCSSSHRARSTF